MKLDDYVTTKKIGEILGISQRKAQEMIREGFYKTSVACPCGMSHLVEKQEVFMRRSAKKVMMKKVD